jgi:putative transposase
MRTRLAKSVADAGWSQLMRCIQEKAAQYGRTFAKVGRFLAGRPAGTAW